MKKIIFSLLLVLIPTLSFAQGPPLLSRTYGFTTATTQPAAPGLPLQGLNAGFLKAQWDITSNGTGPSFSSCTFEVDGSQDGTNWPSRIIAPTSCTSDGMSVVTAMGTATSFVRVNVTALVASSASIPVLNVNIGIWNEVTGASSTNPLFTTVNQSTPLSLNTTSNGVYNTPQSNSTAPLANVTPAAAAPEQLDISGRLIVTPGVTQMTWQPSQTSAITAVTTTRNTFTGLGQFNMCYVVLVVTANGTATGTLNLYIEDSSDGGTTWDDLISSLALTFGSGTNGTQRFTITGNILGQTVTTAAATNITQGSAPTTETLAAGSARQGPFGDRVRIREKVSGPAGSPVGMTYNINAVCKN